MKGEEGRTSFAGFKDGGDDQFTMSREEERKKRAGKERSGPPWIMEAASFEGFSRWFPREFLRRYVVELLNVAVYIRIDARDARSVGSGAAPPRISALSAAFFSA
jgi:hypothetical protein